MSYSTAAHCKFHNRYHIVWITKYRYKVLTRTIRLRLRSLIRQICKTIGVRVIKGVLSCNHVHMFVEIPPKLSVSDVMRRIKGATSRKLQIEFPILRTRYWGRRFWARGYFCTTSGNVTNEIILQYIQNHLEKPTDHSR
ncbi:MAG: IS200/IS605 family transposase [Robiginitomaculum sp.]|nr:MAG: IS200/IS605 family transposase [Robiginitomaculum sp.]